MSTKLCLLLVEEPSTYASVAKKKVWREGMHEEISTVMKNKTWTMVKPGKYVKPIGVNRVV